MAEPSLQRAQGLLLKHVCWQVVRLLLGGMFPRGPGWACGVRAGLQPVCKLQSALGPTGAASGLPRTWRRGWELSLISLSQHAPGPRDQQDGQGLGPQGLEWNHCT